MSLDVYEDHGILNQIWVPTQSARLFYLQCSPKPHRQRIRYLEHRNSLSGFTSFFPTQLFRCMACLRHMPAAAIAAWEGCATKSCAAIHCSPQAQTIIMHYLHSIYWIGKASPSCGASDLLLQWSAWVVALLKQIQLSFRYIHQYEDCLGILRGFHKTNCRVHPISPTIPHRLHNSSPYLHPSTLRCQILGVTLPSCSPSPNPNPSPSPNPSPNPNPNRNPSPRPTRTMMAVPSTFLWISRTVHLRTSTALPSLMLEAIPGALPTLWGFIIFGWDGFCLFCNICSLVGWGEAHLLTLKSRYPCLQQEHDLLSSVCTGPRVSGR